MYQCVSLYYIVIVEEHRHHYLTVEAKLSKLSQAFAPTPRRKVQITLYIYSRLRLDSPEAYLLREIESNELLI